MAIKKKAKHIAIYYAVKYNTVVIGLISALSLNKIILHIEYLCGYSNTHK